MGWFIVIVIIGIVWLLIKANTRKPRSAVSTGTEIPKPEIREAPEIKFTITTSSVREASSRNDTKATDVGDLVDSGNGSWVLNPRSPLPLTLYNADRETAATLKELLSKAQYWTQKLPDIALFIAQHNLQFKEVDAFIAECKSKFETELEHLTATSPEWSAASEKDREDILADFERTAIQSLGISVGQADLLCLLQGKLTNFTEDDELIRRFSGNSSLYTIYLSLLGRSGEVVKVKVDDYRRKPCEQLVDMGLARRGKDIPPHLLLEGLRVKDINALLIGAVEKPIGRKAKAIEAALNLPDLDSRLSAAISFREMFQVLPPSDIDTQELGKAFAYATALATAVQQTYYTGVRTLEAIAERKRDSGVYDAWEITNWGNPVPACAVAICKKYDRLPAKRPPLHIGCNCQLECSFKE